MNYKDIRSKSALPHNHLGKTTTRNNKAAFNHPIDLTTSRQKNDVSPLKTPRAKFGRVKEERTYSEIRREKEKFINQANSPKGLSKKNSNKNLVNVGNIQTKFNNTVTNTAKKLKNQNSIGSNMSLKKSNSSQSQNDAIKTYLKRIFEYYCQFGERLNVNFLKSHKYQKFAFDADIIDSKLTKSKLEVVFSSEIKSNNKLKSHMDFETFLNSLIKLGEIKFVVNKNDILNKFNNKSNNALQMLLKYHVWPLYERIFGSPVIINMNVKGDIIDKEVTNFGILDGSKQMTSDENSTIILPISNDILSQMGTNAKREEMHEINTSINFNETKGRKITPDYSISNTNANNTVQSKNHARKSTFNIVNSLVNVDELLVHSQLEDILKAIAPVMYEIYKVYFPWEISLSDDEAFLKENSTREYFVFLKDFDLCPNLINKSAAFHILQSEISSTISPMSELNEYYTNIIKNIEVNTLGRTNNKNIIGKFFTFIKFLKVICKIGDLGFEKLDLSNSPNDKEVSDNKKLTQIEKICLVLERMELSDGFSNLEKKTNKTHTKKTSYIMPREMLDSVKQGINAKFNDENDFNIIYDLENLNDAKNAELMQENHRKTKLRKSVLGNFKNLFEHTNHLLEKYGNQLNNIYKFYCSFGDPLNTTQMKIHKFSKFLREAGLVKVSSTNNSMLNTSSLLNVTMSQNIGIKMTDIDVIFFKLSGNANSFNVQTNHSSDQFNITRGSINLNHSQLSMMSLNSTSPTSHSKRGSIINSNAKIDFTGFVNSIELISLQIYPNKNEIEAIDLIMNNNVLPLIEKFVGKNNEQYKVIVKEKKENKEFVLALNCLNKAINPIYRFYQKNGVLTFDAFIKFCSDFSIFPDLVSKSKLNMFFKTTMNNEFIFTDNGENETIDQDLFVEILALCAFEIPYRAPEPNSVEKIILFAEKITQSDGPDKIIKQYGHTRLPNGETMDFIAIFKTTFPVYFHLPDNKKAGFFDVLNECEENI